MVDHDEGAVALGECDELTFPGDSVAPAGWYLGVVPAEA